MKQEYIEDKEFGQIPITRKKNVRNIIMRVIDCGIKVTTSTSATSSEIKASIEKFRERLRAQVDKEKKKTPRTPLGSTPHMVFDRVELTFIPARRENLSGSYANNRITINYPDHYPIDHERLQIALKSLTKKMLETAAYHTLIPRAKTLAKECGIEVTQFKVGRGRKQLGCCDNKGAITLSCLLLLLPDYLCDYIIYHELAHRTHLNHSAAFHQLCNDYCKGREAVWEEALKKAVFLLD